jgi:zinc/manganese transport system substrate-binding protein
MRSRFRKLLPPLLIATLCLAFARDAQAGPLKIVTTTTDLASIATAIGGDKVDVQALVPGGFNADFYDPRPSDLFKIHRARMFVQVGLGLEEWARDLVNEANNADLIKADVSYQVPLLDIPKGRVDYSFGDIHPYGNPHYQLDPEAGRVVARNIFNALAYADPANKDYFASNLAAFDQRLTEAEAKWRQQMAPYAGTKFIPYHESWDYFARAFNMRIPGTIESKPGFVPSPARVQEVVELAKREGVKAIVTEPYYEVSIAQLIAEQAGIPLLNLTIDVGGTPEQKDYISMIDYVVARFVAALSGHAD